MVRPLREPGEGPLEGAPPEYVPGAEEERAPGEGAPPRPRADLREDVESHRERHEGIRGMGAGEGTVRPSAERRGSAELGRQHASGRNYRISDGDALEEGGEVAKKRLLQLMDAYIEESLDEDDEDVMLFFRYEFEDKINGIEEAIYRATKELKIKRRKLQEAQESQNSE